MNQAHWCMEKEMSGRGLDARYISIPTANGYKKSCWNGVLDRSEPRAIELAGVCFVLQSVM